MESVMVQLWTLPLQILDQLLLQIEAAVSLVAELEEWSVWMSIPALYGNGDNRIEGGKLKEHLGTD